MFNGITRGLQLIATFMLFMAWAAGQAQKGTLQPLLDGIQVGTTWYKETTGVALDAKRVTAAAININMVGLLFGSDPWAGSRAQLQALLVKYPTRS